MKPQPPWSSARATGRGGSCPISCARRPRSTPPFGGVVPEIAARAHVDVLDGIIDARDEGSRRRLCAAFGGRRRRRPRPDRRRDRRPDHREGDRDGARHAADRGQSSRGPRADAAADLRAGISLLPVSRLRRPHPDRRRDRRRQLCAARHHRRRRHGRSLRQGRKDARAALSGRTGGRARRRRRRRQSGLRFRGRCSGAPTPISRCRD